MRKQAWKRRKHLRHLTGRERLCYYCVVDTETKDTIVKVRLTTEEKELVRRAAEIVGMTISDYFRERMLDTSQAIVMVHENQIDEKKMIEMENVRATYLSTVAAS